MALGANKGRAGEGPLAPWVPGEGGDFSSVKPLPFSLAQNPYFGTLMNANQFFCLPRLLDARDRIGSVAIFLALAALLQGCSGRGGGGEAEALAASERPVYYRDLSDILADGKLRAMTTYSATSYFLYRGEPMGFEYELLTRFADYLDVELELVVPTDIDSLFYDLQAGTADILAHGLTVTKDRLTHVDFTDHFYTTHQVLVQRKPENWRSLNWRDLERSLIHDPMELIGDTVSVRRNSSYFERLVNLDQELGGGIVIDTLPGHLSTEEIIQMVVEGKIKYTVADDNIASINASYFPELDISVQIGFSQRVAWAVRKNSPELLAATNAWIGELKKDVDFYVIYNNYFRNQRDFRRRIDSELYSLSKQAISPYDDIVRRHAERIGWDWRLLAALIYQESRFEPGAQAWSSAAGLMQLMPATAEELGVTDPSDPVQSIRGGADYLHQLWGQFEHIPDSVQRIKFAMAAYNSGYGHVLDAQRLASKRGLDSLTWDGNVAETLLGLSSPQNYTDPVVYYGYVRGIEPYTYVQQIFARYGHYAQFVE